MQSQRLIRFLLVEDDDRHAKLVQKVLSQNRIDNFVHRVRDGEEALEFLNATASRNLDDLPDVILLDLKLPKLDGMAVLEAVKKDARLVQIPVVMMTTSDAETDRLRAYRLNVNSYLVKPVDFDKFQRMVLDLSFYWGVWNRPAH